MNAIQSHVLSSYFYVQVITLKQKIITYLVDVSKIYINFVSLFNLCPILLSIKHNSSFNLQNVRKNKILDRIKTIDIGCIDINFYSKYSISFEHSVNSYLSILKDVMDNQAFL